jgi:hypothetical protein
MGKGRNWTAEDNAFFGSQFGLSTDFAAPGDYYSDGKTDYAIVRKGATASVSNLVWYILKSSDNALLAYSFGNTETDSSVQNDYDGDGKTDIAVWRESDGTSYVLKSRDNSLQVTNWGLTTDLPIAAYDTH